LRRQFGRCIEVKLDASETGYHDSRSNLIEGRIDKHADLFKCGGQAGHDCGYSLSRNMTRAWHKYEANGIGSGFRSE